jgi:arylsulfatase A-like enzyme
MILPLHDSVRDMKRPNILILFTDQQRWDAVGANGNPDVKTPALDRLAAEGVNFTRCFVQHPKCMPSRASLLTGQYPSTLGITHMGVPVPDDAPTLPRLLGPYGYRSANLGKLHFLPHANRDHRSPHPAYGFDHLEIADEPGCYDDAYRAWVRQRDPSALDAISVGLPPMAKTWQDAMGAPGAPISHPEERFPKRPRPFPAADNLTHTAFVAERTLEFLRAQSGPPFLCVAGFYSPHSPWVVPQRFLDQYDPSAFSLPTFPPDVEARRSATHFSDDELRAARHGYYAMVSEVDHHIGRILDELDDLEERDNTIVVFLSDHGDRLGEHLSYGKGYPARDCVSRIPLLIRWPGGPVEVGRRVDALVEGLDVLPTLLALAGLPRPGWLQGRRLPLGPSFEHDPARASALTEGNGWKALRTDAHRYVIHDDGRERLYDISADPGEYHDRSEEAAYSDEISHHRHALLEHLLRRERPRPRAWPY